MKQQQSIGPFKAMGVVLNSVGTTAVVLDTTIATSGAVINQGLDAINITVTAARDAVGIVTSDAVEALREDTEVAAIIRRAEHKVSIAKATQAANKILAKLTPVKSVNKTK